MKVYNYKLYDIDTNEIKKLTLPEKIVMLRTLFRDDSHVIFNEPALLVFDAIEKKHNDAIDYLESYTHINNSNEVEYVIVVRVAAGSSLMYIRKSYSGSHEYIDEVVPKQVSTVEYVLKYY